MFQRFLLGGVSRKMQLSFFAMLISCSRCSDGSMWLPFW